VESLPSKRRILKRERERDELGLKRKGGETLVEKLHVSKKREDEIFKLLGEILSKERKKGDHNFL
jgi:hypothetical protein